jgi:hypothetical protein
LRAKEETRDLPAGATLPSRLGLYSCDHAQQVCFAWHTWHDDMSDASLVVAAAADAAAAAREVAAALESEALASALRAADYERQKRLAAEAAAAEAQQVCPPMPLFIMFLL